MMNKWYGVKFNIKWPHDGFVFGFAIDYYEPAEGLPWESYVFRIAFLIPLITFLRFLVHISMLLHNYY